MGSKYQMSCFVAVSLCLLFVGCAGMKEMGKPDETSLQTTLGLTGSSIEGTVVTVNGQPEQLTSGPAENGNGDYHPEGTRIAFQSNRDGKWQVYELSLTDMTETRLRESEFNEENPVWSSEGNNLLFVSSKEGENEWDREIMKYNVQLGDLYSVTNSPGDDWYPVVMNENFCVFLSERDSNQELPVHVRANSVYLANLNGGSPTFLSGTSDDFRAPSVVNDDNLLVLNRFDQIILYDLNTRDSKVMSPEGIVCGSSDYSNGAGLVVFTGSTGGPDTLFILDTENGVYQRINTGFSNIRYPQFSPDGQWILFGAEVDDHFQLFRLNITSL